MFLLEPRSLYFRSLDTTCSEQLPGNIESCPGEGALPWVRIQLGVHQHVEVQGLATCKALGFQRVYGHSGWAPVRVPQGCPLLELASKGQGMNLRWLRLGFILGWKGIEIKVSFCASFGLIQAAENQWISCYRNWPFDLQSELQLRSRKTTLPQSTFLSSP